jgi:hypothetical protein
MNAYLVFALVAALRLVAPGTAHFTIDSIENGSPASQFAVSTEGSYSRFVLAGSTKEEYMRVEQASAFGQVYTVLPGAALDAAASASAATGPVKDGAQAPAGLQKVVRLPPIAFSLGGVMDKLGPLSPGSSQTMTIDDPVEALLNAVQPQKKADGGQQTSAMGNGSTTAPAAVPGTSSPGTSGPGPVGGSAGGPAALTVTVSRRGELAYLGIPGKGVLLAVHILP